MKKVALVAPTTKGGPYHLYKQLYEYINNNFSDSIHVDFFHSVGGRFMSHYKAYDTVISVVPMLWRPLGAKKYYFNPHGNRTVEKTRPGWGRKLLYLAENNLKFSDKIILPSLFLADKIDFYKTYKDKIITLPNFVDIEKYQPRIRQQIGEKVTILTITSFKFFDKGKGILDLAKVIRTYAQKTHKTIIWSIAGNNDSDNFRTIKKQFDAVQFPKNVIIKWLGWITKQDLINQIAQNDVFLYRTYLDNFPKVVVEAMASGMYTLVNNFESFKYFVPAANICESQAHMIAKLHTMEEDLSKQSASNIAYVEKFGIQVQTNKRIKL